MKGLAPIYGGITIIGPRLIIISGGGSWEYGNSGISGSSGISSSSCFWNSNNSGNSGFDDSCISDSRRLRAPTTIVLGFPDKIATIINGKMIVDKQM